MKRLLKIGILSLACITASQARTVNVDGCTVFTEKQINQIAGTASTIEEAAKLLGKKYTELGYLYVTINVDKKTSTVTCIEKKQNGVGKYGKYFSSTTPLSVSKLQIEADRMLPELRANNELVNVRLDSHGQYLDVTTSARPAKNQKDNGVAVIFSNYGQKNSGENVGSIYGYAKPGNGQLIEGTVSHAFQSNNAENGNFNGGVLSYKKYSWLGETSIKGSISDYSSGGDQYYLGLSGRVLTANFEQAYLIYPGVKFYGGVAVNSEKKYFNLIDSDDLMRNYFASIGIRGDYNYFNYDLSINHGIAAFREYNYVPLLGVNSPHFKTFNVESEYIQPIENLEVSLKSGAQIKIGDENTPSFAQLYAGGLDRGRAYNTGFTSIQNGAFGRIKLSYPATLFGLDGARAYAGVDGIYGEAITKVTVNAYSAFIGFSGVASNFNYDLSLAKKIGAQVLSDNDDYKFLANISLTL